MVKKHELEIEINKLKINKSNISIIYEIFYDIYSLLSIALAFNNIKLMKKIIKLDNAIFYTVQQDVIDGLINVFRHDEIIKFIKLFPLKEQKKIFEKEMQYTNWINLFIESCNKRQLLEFMEFPLSYSFAFDQSYILKSYMLGSLKIVDRYDEKNFIKTLKKSKKFIDENKNNISPLSEIDVKKFNEEIYTTYLKYFPNGLIQCDKYNYNALSYIMQHNSIKFFNFAMQYIKKHNRNDHNFFNLVNTFIIAIITNNEYFVTELLKFPNLDLNIHDNNKMTPGHLILEKTCTISDETKSLILEKTNNINNINLNGDTLLNLICKKGFLVKYKNILKTKICDPYIKDLDGKTPIYYCNNIELFAKIVTQGFIFNSHKLQFDNKCLPKLLNMNMYDKIYKCIKNEFDNVIKNKYEFDKRLSIVIPKESYTPHPLYTSNDIDNYIYIYYYIEKHNVKTFIKTSDLNNTFSNFIGLTIRWQNNKNNNGIDDLKQQLGTISDGIYFIDVTIINTRGTHVNGIIIDANKKKVIYFEPYGFFDNENIDILHKKLRKICKTAKYAYYSPESYMTITSFQPLSKERNINEMIPGDPAGFCVAWTLWFLEVYVNNPKSELKELVEESIKEIIYSKKTFKQYIRSYSNKLAQYKFKYLTNIKYPAIKILNNSHMGDNYEFLMSEINKSYGKIKLLT